MIKYLSSFPVIKKINYKNPQKLDNFATKCYNNTNKRKKPFLLLVQLNGWKEPLSKDSSQQKECNMRFRMLLVYQDGQATTSTFNLRNTAMMVFNSASTQKRITYGEVLDMTTGETITEVHRAFTFKANTYHK